MDAALRALKWRTSSYSGDKNNCVELASLAAEVAVRDSKDPEGGALLLSRAAWRKVADSVKAGQLDLR